MRDGGGRGIWERGRCKLVLGIRVYVYGCLCVCHVCMCVRVVFESVCACVCVRCEFVCEYVYVCVLGFIHRERERAECTHVQLGVYTMSVMRG